MLQYEPTFRPSISEIKAMPWFNGPVPTLYEVQQEFSVRKARIQAEQEEKRLAREEERKRMAGGAGGRRVYKSIHTEATRGDLEEEDG